MGHKIAILIIPPDGIIDKPFYYRERFVKEDEVSDPTKGHLAMLSEFASQIGLRTSEKDVTTALVEFGCVTFVTIGEQDFLVTGLPYTRTGNQRDVLLALRKFISRYDYLEFSSIDGIDFYVSTNDPVTDTKEELLDYLYRELDKYYMSKRI